MFRRVAAGTASRRSPGGVLPVERVPGLPDLPGLGPARGRARARRRSPGRDGTERGPGRRHARTTRTTTTRRRLRAIRPIRPSGETRRGIGPRRHRGPSVRPGRRVRPARVRRWRRCGVRGAGVPDEPSGSEFLASRSVEGQGLAGSAADRLAGAPPPSSAGGPSVGEAAAVSAARPAQAPRRRRPRRARGSRPRPAGIGPDPAPHRRGRLSPGDGDRQDGHRSPRPDRPAT